MSMMLDVDDGRPIYSFEAPDAHAPPINGGDLDAVQADRIRAVESAC
jgi:hypothetical protein